MLHDSKCSKYYDDESAGFARNSSASFIYVMFGYDKCCGTQKQSHIAPLPVRMEEHNSKLTLYGLQMLGLPLIFFTINFFVPEAVKLAKRHYGANRNDNSYDEITLSQKEEKL